MNFLTKNAPTFLPDIFGSFILWVRKDPAKFPPNLPAKKIPMNQRTPGGGGAQKSGGGKTSRGDPPRKTVSDPLTSVRFASPPIPFLLVSPLEIPRISLS